MGRVSNRRVTRIRIPGRGKEGIGVNKKNKNMSYVQMFQAHACYS